jgi:GNAT superfamily N-acetyltransferase
VISPERHRLFLETDHSLLAVADDQPIGFLLTEPLDDALFIVEIAVHQAWQGQGIGRMMLEQVIETPGRRRIRRSPSPPSATCRGMRRFIRAWDFQCSRAKAAGGLAAKRELETARPAAGNALRHAPGAVASGADFSGEYGTKYHSKLTR